MVHATPRVGRPTFKEEEERVDTDWAEVHRPHLEKYSSGYWQVKIQGVRKVKVQGSGKVSVQGVGHCAEVKSQGAEAGGMWSTMMVAMLCFFSLYKFQKHGKSTRGAGLRAGTVVDRTIF